MKQEIVGIYELGHEYVELVLREGVGGEFYLMPEKGKVPRIKIGADQEKWWHVVSVLIHESMEMAYHRLGVRYHRSFEMADNAASFLFVMDHQQFAEAAAMVGEFITTSLPDLAKVWNRRKKPPRKKPVRRKKIAVVGNNPASILRSIKILNKMRI